MKSLPSGRSAWALDPTAFPKWRQSSNMRIQNHSRGFTLIELMIAVAIVAILSAVALPSYSAYIERAKRADAKAVLLNAAQYLERFRSSNFKYPLDSVQLPEALRVAPENGTKQYDIAMSGSTASSQLAFTLTATPSGWTDSKCGNLTLTNLGVKGQSIGDAATCWNK